MIEKPSSRHAPDHAATDGREFLQLSASDAKDIADELNRCDAEGDESPLL